MWIIFLSCSPDLNIRSSHWTSSQWCTFLSSPQVLKKQIPVHEKKNKKNTHLYQYLSALGCWSKLVPPPHYMDILQTEQPDQEDQGLRQDPITISGTVVWIVLGSSGFRAVKTRWRQSKTWQDRGIFSSTNSCSGITDTPGFSATAGITLITCKLFASPPGAAVPPPPLQSVVKTAQDFISMEGLYTQWGRKEANRMIRDIYEHCIFITTWL